MGNLLCLDVDVPIDFVDELEDDVKIEANLFIGEQDNPSGVFETTFGDMIDQFIEYNSIPGGSVRPEYRDTMLNMIDKLQLVLNQKRVVIHELPEWVKQDV